MILKRKNVTVNKRRIKITSRHKSILFLYPEQLHNDLPFLPERMKLEKVKKLVANLMDKTEYLIHIRNLKQAWNHGLILKKLYRVIKFNQKAWPKPYIEMNSNTKCKKFWKSLFQVNE